MDLMRFRSGLSRGRRFSSPTMNLGALRTRKLLLHCAAFRLNAPWAVKGRTCCFEALVRVVA